MRRLPSFLFVAPCFAFPIGDKASSRKAKVKGAIASNSNSRATVRRLWYDAGANARAISHVLILGRVPFSFPFGRFTMKRRMFVYAWLLVFAASGCWGPVSAVSSGRRTTTSRTTARSRQIVEAPPVRPQQAVQAAPDAVAAKP
jgi:hypothetical protein